MDREQSIQVLSELINTCVQKGIFNSSNEVITAHNALVILAQASMPPQIPETTIPPAE